MYKSEPARRGMVSMNVGLSAASPKAKRSFFSAPFTVSAQSDRQGVRLDGPEVAPQEGEILTCGVVSGAVQVPRGGQPIVLLADHQTTGGYPRLGEVASIDLPLVAQLKPGDRLRFRLVSVEEAQQLFLAQERELALAQFGIALRHPRGTT